MHRPPPHPMDETERLEALARYRILDTEAEPQFDRIVEIARRQFNVPIALVAFMDKNRNFLKASGNLEDRESPRDISFCGHAILTDQVTVVLDATKDDRFKNSPLVTSEPKVRFYAGAPLITHDKRHIGTVCLFDFSPRDSFDLDQRSTLAELASVVVDHLEMRFIVGNVSDEISTRKAAEEEVRWLAFHDPLTGLHNRVWLHKSFQDGLEFEDLPKVGALCVDLDNFSMVNKTLGESTGDAALKSIARHLESLAGEKAFTTHLGSDEFVILKAFQDKESVEKLADSIVKCLADEIGVNEQIMPFSASIGVASIDRDRLELETLLRQAETAASTAKAGGRGQRVVFNLEMAEQTERRRILENDLAKALKEDAIEVHFQPIVKAQDRAIVGVECLARWTHEKLGVIGPMDFIEMAEKTGQIMQLGEALMRKALRASREWDGIFVAVNISPLQFRLPDFSQTIVSLLEEVRFPAHRLELAITESVLLDDIDGASRQVEKLHQAGVKISLDDFGTGYSSLSYLKRIAFDKVKIDRSFAHDVEINRTSRAVVNCVLALARELRMEVTAEGIETKEQEDFFRTAGCDTLQGFLFHRPAPAETIGRFLRLDELSPS